MMIETCNIIGLDVPSIPLSMLFVHKTPPFLLVVVVLPLDKFLSIIEIATILFGSPNVLTRNGLVTAEIKEDNSTSKNNTLVAVS